MITLQKKRDQRDTFAAAHEHIDDAPPITQPLPKKRSTHKAQTEEEILSGEEEEGSTFYDEETDKDPKELKKCAHLADFWDDGSEH